MVEKLLTAGFALIGATLFGVAGNSVGHSLGSTATGKRTSDLFASAAKSVSSSNLPKA